MREDWEVKKLGDVCSSIKDGSHNPPKGINGSCFLMLSSQNIQDGYIDFNNSRFLSEEDFYKERKRVKVQKGDLLLTIVGTIGRSCIFDGSVDNIVFQRSVAILTPKPDIISPYLRYFIKSKKDFLESEAKGVAQKGIYLRQLSDFKIQVPPLQTQHQIVEELDCLTSIIEKQKKQLEELDNLAQAIFYDMFGDPIENEKGWKVFRFCELFSLKSGNSLSANKQIPGIFNVYGGNGITGTHIEFNRKGEYIIIGRVGAYCGNVRIVNGSFWLTDNAFELIQKTEKQNSKYLLYLLRLIDLFKYANHAAQPVISNTVLQNVIIPLPPLPLQQQFASKIEAIEKQKELIKKSIKETEDLFNSRMDYYFN